MIVRGLGVFGPAYRYMLENDTHTPGSVDRILMENMIRLDASSVEYLYQCYTPLVIRYQKGGRPQLERYLQEILSGCQHNEEKVEVIARFTAGIKNHMSEEPDAIRFGGTEEEIIERGTDICTDLAQVGCALCQVAGFPSRLVYLADTEKAYSGHALIEVYRCGAWGAVDTSTGVVYRHTGGKPASVWDLMNEPELIEKHHRGDSTPFTNPRQFRAAAVSNYFIWERDKYDYTISRINDYYRSIFEMVDKGWPGGLRWLHGENNKIEENITLITEMGEQLARITVRDYATHQLVCSRIDRDRAERCMKDGKGRLMSHKEIADLVNRVTEICREHLGECKKFESAVTDLLTNAEKIYEVERGRYIHYLIFIKDLILHLSLTAEVHLD